MRYNCYMSSRIERSNVFFKEFIGHTFALKQRATETIRGATVNLPRQRSPFIFLRVSWMDPELCFSHRAVCSSLFRLASDCLFIFRSFLRSNLRSLLAFSLFLFSILISVTVRQNQGVLRVALTRRRDFHTAARVVEANRSV